MKGRRLQSLLQRALAVQLALAAVVVVAAVALFLGYRAESERSERVRESLLALQALRAEVLSAETGLRGYALTREPRFLDPYERAFTTIDRHVARLRADLPQAEQARLSATAATVADWRAGFAEPALAALRTGRAADARRLFDSGAGKRRIDRVRRLVAQMSAAERLRLSRERDRLESDAVAGLVAIGFGALLVLVGAFLLRRWLIAWVVRPVVELALDVSDAGIVGGDRVRLRQTFANLLSNAIKFSPRGGRVDVRADGDEREAVVEVADQGPGIPAEEIAHISERFFRASTARAVKGTGLGLTIAREIAELHGGRLEVSSTVGAGSRFRIRLPRGQPDGGRPAEPAAQPGAGGR